MFKEVKMLTLVCDRCGKDICDGTENAAWNDEQPLKDSAEAEGWVNHEGNDYCDTCHYYDDDDNLIIKS